MRKLVVDVLRSSARDELGQTMAEYGVILAVVTLGVLGAMTLLGNNVSAAFSGIAGLLP
jgi:Flp pilus assembly pilin Flp